MYDRIGESVAEVSGTDVDTLSGQLGYTVDGVFRVVDPDDSRKFFVRYTNGNWVSAFHYGRVIQKPNLGVITSTDNLGQPYIVGEDKGLSSPNNSNSGNVVGYHTHVRGGGMDYITDTWLLKQLRVAPVTGTLTVSITAGFYFFNWKLQRLAAGTLDLSGYYPTTAAASWWVIVGINPLTQTLTVLHGDEFFTGTTADPALIPLIAFLDLGYIPLCAVHLQQGDTSIPPYRFEDLRFEPGSPISYLENLINYASDYYAYDGYVLTREHGYWVPRPPSGGSSLSSITVRDSSGTPSFSAKTLEFVGGTLTQPVADVARYTPPSGGGGALTQIASIEASSGSVTDFTFTSIPNTYTSLRLVLYGRSSSHSGATPYCEVYAQFNADTGNHYDFQDLYGLNSGANAAGSYAQGQMFVGWISGDGAGAGAIGTIELLIPGYAQTHFHKATNAKFGSNAESAGTNSISGTATGAWRDTSAIATLKIFPGAGNFVQWSKAVLYGEN